MSKRKTAAELMVELQANSEFQRGFARREERREAKQKKYDKVLSAIVAELGSLGLQGDSLQKIVEANAPLGIEAVDVLRTALQVVKDIKPLDSVVRALGAAAAPFDGRCLSECFENTNDESLKWAIANTISIVKPHSIDKWIEEQLRHPTWGTTFRDLGIE